MGTLRKETEQPLCQVVQTLPDQQEPWKICPSRVLMKWPWSLACRYSHHSGSTLM